MEYELYHHGILGMKWGIRRYQNRDGSLTPAGRRRYHNEDGSLNEEGKKYYDSLSDDEKRFQELSRKNPSQLSTQELTFMNNRIQQKNSYLSNTESQVSKLLRTAATQVASQLAAEYMKAGVKKVLSFSGKKVDVVVDQKTKSDNKSQTPPQEQPKNEGKKKKKK